MLDARPVKSFILKEKGLVMFETGNSVLVVLLLVFVSVNSSSVFSRDLPNRKIVANYSDLALKEAIEKDDYEAFNHSLLLGADPTEWLGNSQFDWVMCAAAEVGKEKFLNLLIEKGHDVNFRQSDISTFISLPLTCAIRFNNLKALEMLIVAGADPTLMPCDTCSNRAPMSVMSAAIIVRKYDLAAWLFDKGAYSEDQLDTDIHLLETIPVNESAPGNVYRLRLADLFRQKGYEVNLWTRGKK